MLTIKKAFSLKGITYFLFFLLSVAPAFSQQLIRCAMPEHHMGHEAEFERVAPQTKTLSTTATESVYKIPVVVHIVHHNADGIIGGSDNDNISEEQVISQIKVLNEDFRRQNADTVNTPPNFVSDAVDTRIEFCLANIDPYGNSTDGITRHFTVKESFDYIADDKELKAIGNWPSSDYLNIWVTSVSGPGSQTVLGYAQFPDSYRTGVEGLPPYQGEETDGVVVDYRFFGNQIGTSTNPYYGYGRTTTHEVGHYLGLLHTFHNFSNRCQTDADFCVDTPIQDLPTNDIFPDACPTNETSCGSIKMIENYMDYTQDQCMNLFTQDQKDRMRDILELSESRNSLLSSHGCCDQSLTGLPLTVKDDFETPSFSLDFWENDSSYSPDYHWQLSESAINNSLTAISNNTLVNDTAVIVSKLIHFTKEEDFLDPTLRYDLNYSDFSNNDDRVILTVQFAKSCTNDWQTISTISSGSDILNANENVPYTPSVESYTTFITNLNNYLPEEFSSIRLRFIHISSSETQIHLDNVIVNPNTNSTPSLTVFPNPSNGYVSLQFLVNEYETVDLTIYDTQGKIIKTSSVNILSDTYNYDLSELSSGLYILEANIAGNIIRQKLVIQK